MPAENFWWGVLMTSLVTGFAFGFAIVGLLDPDLRLSHRSKLLTCSVYGVAISIAAALTSVIAGIWLWVTP